MIQVSQVMSPLRRNGLKGRAFPGDAIDEEGEFYRCQH